MDPPVQVTILGSPIFGNSHIVKRLRVWGVRSMGIS